MTARVRLLGRVTVHAGGAGLDLSDVEAEVLAALLLARPDGLTDGELSAFAVPPGTPADEAGARLRRIVPGLFADLAAARAGLSVRRAGDRWLARADAGVVDADDLATLVGRAGQLLADGLPADARFLLDRGLHDDLVDEPPLEDLTDPWFDGSRAALVRLQADALVHRSDADFALADPAPALPRLRAAVDLDHLATDVRLWDRLAVALVACGQDDRALATLDQGVTVLRAAGQDADVAALGALREDVRRGSPAVRARVALRPPPLPGAPPVAATWDARVVPWVAPRPAAPPAWGTPPDAWPRAATPGLRVSPVPAPPAPATPSSPAPPLPLRWSLFGPVLLHQGNRRVPLDEVTALLLATLVLRRGTAVGADDLASAAWPAERPPEPATGIEVHLERAAAAVSPARLPVTSGAAGAGTGTWTFSTQGSHVDVDLATEAASRARAASDPQRSADGLRAALALVPGAPLDGLPGDLAGPRRDLSAWREALLFEAVAADLAAGLTERALPDLRALVEDHPLREDLWEWLVVATARHEGRDAALAVYDRAARRLDRLLGADPGPRLQAARRDVEQRYL